jgi:anti-sigma factor RsiW
MAHEELPADLLWEKSHASELALSAFADGEETLLSRDMVQHLQTCSACAMRLGEMALVTRGVTHAVQSARPWLPAEMQAPSRVTSGMRNRSQQPAVPWAAIVGALVLTAVGVAPKLLALPHQIAALAVSLMHAAPVVSHSGVQVIQQGLGAQWAQAMLVCAALLIAAGFAVTRLLPRPTAS